MTVPDTKPHNFEGGRKGGVVPHENRNLIILKEEVEAALFGMKTG